MYSIGEVFADSVRELCKNDYEPTTIERWVASKSPESRMEFIDKGLLWVAEIGDKIAGYLVSIPGEIVPLFVASSYAGQGVGRALYEVGVEMAKKGGTSEIKLEATITAAPFYKKLGFKEVSRGYYTHGQMDLRLPIINMVYQRGCTD